MAEKRVSVRLAAGVAMVRSGLQTIDAQAKLAQSLGTTVASIQTLGGGTHAGDREGIGRMGTIARIFSRQRAKLEMRKSHRVRPLAIRKPQHT